MKSLIKLRSQSTQVILDAATKKGINVQVVSKRFQLVKLTLGNIELYIKGTSLPVNSQPACFIANNKYLTKSVLRSNDLPTPKSWLVKTAKEATKVVREKCLFPCVLKPSKGAHGHGVYANIESFEELNEVLPLIFAKPGKKNVLVEEYVKGKDYRLLVVGDKVSAVMERIPAHVVGDGKNSIKKLIDIFNSSPMVGKRYEKPLCKIIYNGEIGRNLKKQNKKLSDIPNKNETVVLRQNANISTGGIGKDVTDEVGSELKKIAIKAAKAIGIAITGVDIIYDEVSKKSYILELNDTPGIDIHHFPVYGKPRDVAHDIVEYLFKGK